MSGSASVPSEEKIVRRELAKRRIFGFVSVLGVVLSLGPFREELDSLPALADDLAFLIVAASALALIAAMRNRIALPDLRRQNHLLLGLYVAALAAKLLGAVLEAGDAADAADEGMAVIVTVLAVLNRFVW